MQKGSKVQAAHAVQTLLILHLARPVDPLSCSSSGLGEISRCFFGHGERVISYGLVPSSGYLKGRLNLILPPVFVAYKSKNFKFFGFLHLSAL